MFRSPENILLDKENKCARAQNVNFASILYMCDEFEVFYVWVS
jgi:hypothetical protein